MSDLICPICGQQLIYNNFIDNYSDQHYAFYSGNKHNEEYEDFIFDTYYIRRFYDETLISSNNKDFTRIKMRVPLDKFNSLDKIKKLLALI